jgi:16S rRNA G527 N7-methylase RsmG
MLRVRLMDESEKVILIDESEKVVQILRTVCEKVGLTNPSEFGFTVEQMSKCTDEFQGWL